MKNLKNLPFVFSIVFLMGCFYLVMGQSNDDKSAFASINSFGSSVRFEVAAPHASVVLTVLAPDGQAFIKEFQSGSSPEFKLTDSDVEKLPDGQYTYELRVNPNIAASVRETLATARAKGNGAAVQRELKRRGTLPPELIQSGSFIVQNGSIIVPGAVEGQRGPARATTERAVSPVVSSSRVNYKIQRHHPRFLVFDQVIPDDLIVQGSVCAGIDCVNNENFGFDTIRVKENNTRIQFDDTSTSAGFATNNWQIRANDSASGGASFLGFVDQGANGTSETGTVVFAVNAGAPANSIRVSSTGRVGFRTATPVLDMHASTSDTPAIRLEQNNSGGFTAQTWDIAGNEANFFVRDVTSGSRLPFRIRPGAPTSSIDVSANGNVGLGTGGPNARLDVKQADDTFIGGLHLRRPGALNDTWALVTGADNNFYFGYANNASLANAHADFTVIPLVLTSSNRVGINTAAPDQTLSVNGNASKVGGGSWLTFSDQRLKNLNGPFTRGLKALMQLQPLRYHYRSNNALGLPSEREYVGLGAQAVQAVIPEAITNSENGYLMINNDPIILTMLNAIKEQQQQIQELKREIRHLRRAKRRR